MNKKLLVVIIFGLILVTFSTALAGGSKNGTYIHFEQSGGYDCHTYWNKTGSGLVHEWRNNDECAPYAEYTSLHLVFKPQGKFFYADCDDADLLGISSWTANLANYTDHGGDEADLAEFITDGENYWVCFYMWGDVDEPDTEPDPNPDPDPDPEEPGEEESVAFRWMPPVSLENHEVHLGAVLPIKFKLMSSDGSPLPEGEEPVLEVEYLGNGEMAGDGSEELNLKRGFGGTLFLAHFRPDMAGEYQVKVTYGELEPWVADFTVVDKNNNEEMPQGEQKVTGQDKEKPVKPEPEEKEKKPKGKPEDKPGKGPKKP